MAIMKKFQRARSDEQKAIRLNAIYDAAAALFDESEYTELTMSRLAERAGLKKASLYNYFGSKEEVFMRLFLRELDVWIEDFAKRSARLRKPQPARVAGLIADLLVEHSRFTRLFAILSSIIERNVAAPALREFKLETLARMARLAESTQRMLPQMALKRIFEFQTQLHIMITGLWPIAHPNAQLQEALDTEPLRDFKIEFHPTCKSLLIRLLAD